jgi:hypothetical protein
MTAINSISAFHQWLLAEPSGQAPIRTIILHGDSDVFSERLIEEIADYLNEYDDDDAGCWLGATSDLVNQISIDGNLRELLGIAEGCPNCPPTSPCGTRKTLAALGNRGHVIFRDVTGPEKDLDLPFAFHAGIGSSNEVVLKCHLVLNPNLMDPASLAHIIGDVFLEWLHRELHRVVPVGSGAQ